MSSQSECSRQYPFCFRILGMKLKVLRINEPNALFACINNGESILLFNTINQCMVVSLLPVIILLIRNITNHIGFFILYAIKVVRQ